jgi:hypothetical protein
MTDWIIWRYMDWLTYQTYDQSMCCTDSLDWQIDCEYDWNLSTNVSYKNIIAVLRRTSFRKVNFYLNTEAVTYRSFNTVPSIFLLNVPGTFRPSVCIDRANLTFSLYAFFAYDLVVLLKAGVFVILVLIPIIHNFSLTRYLNYDEDI